MLTIHPLAMKNSLRNYTYLLQEGDDYFCLDPFEAKKVQEFLPKNAKLKGIINTHEHWDHVQGNVELGQKYLAPVWGHKHLIGKVAGLSLGGREGEEIPVGANSYLKVLEAPGHSQYHLLFILVEKQRACALFSGDTLFHCGVGNCQHGGKIEDLFETVDKKIRHLDENLTLYPGHDYLEKNLRFTERYGSGSQQQMAQRLHSQLYAQDSQHWVAPFTTLGEEKKRNPFLQDAVLDHFDTFRDLRQLRDSF